MFRIAWKSFPRTPLVALGTASCAHLVFKKNIGLSSCEPKPHFAGGGAADDLKAKVAKLHPRAEVLSSRASTMLFTIIRDKTTKQAEYVNAADRLMAMLAEEGLARLPCVQEKVVETPCGPFTGLSYPPSDKICCVDIMRSGCILLEAVRRVVPDSKTAKILIQRNEETAEPKLFYSKLPGNIKDLHVILCDPMLATGGSAAMAIDVLKDAGVKEENILFLNVVSAPEGLQKLAEKCPGVTIVTAALDSHLNAQKYIVPGLGDFGDRYYGTED